MCFVPVTGSVMGFVSAPSVPVTPGEGTARALYVRVMALNPFVPLLRHVHVEEELTSITDCDCAFAVVVIVANRVSNNQLIGAANVIFSHSSPFITLFF